jgi:DNA-binding response OmpR family regulator
VIGNLKLDGRDCQAFFRKENLELTRREFELLHLLAAASEQVLERETIYRRIWGYEMVPGDRWIDVFVRKIRQKLKARSPDCTYIHAHFGIGYRFSIVSIVMPAVSEEGRQLDLTNQRVSRKSCVGPV